MLKQADRLKHVSRTATSFLITLLQSFQPRHLFVLTLLLVLELSWFLQKTVRGEGVVLPSLFLFGLLGRKAEAEGVNFAD